MMKTLLYGLVTLSLCSLAVAEEPASLESRLESRFHWDQTVLAIPETITLAELFEQIHEDYQIRIRLDRAVSNLMVESISSESDPVVFQSDQVATYPQTPGYQIPGIQLTASGYHSACPTCQTSPSTQPMTPVGGSPVAYPATPQYTNNYAVPSVSVPVASTPTVEQVVQPAPVNGSVQEASVPNPNEPDANAVRITPVVPIEKASESAPSTPVEEVVSPAPAIPNDEVVDPLPSAPVEEVPEVLEAKTIQIGLHETIFEHCEIPTRYFDDTMTVEQVIRAAIAQIGTMLDVSGELDGIPSSYTHVYDWDLMVKDETVFITTKLQSNLHKIVRVYKTPQEGNFTSEELAACIQKSIRPWSWRDNIDNIVDIVEFDLPDNFQFPDLSASNLKVDLSGDGDLVSVKKDNEGENVASDATSSSPDPSVSWAAMKAMCSLFSTGTKAFAHGMLSTTEMLHYGDPPTGTIETLPNMLIISQSRGAHQEISALMDQITEAATK